MVKGGYKISDIYQGSYSTFSPDQNPFVGYHINAGDFALTTDPRSANIMKELNSKISMGVKGMEIEGISSEVLESIPKQHFQESKRLAKLTGTKLTMHGPLVEASGITKQGFSEANREAAERQMFDAMEKAHELDDKGGVNVTFHSSAQLPGPEIIKNEKGEKQIDQIIAIDRESGQIRAIKRETKHYPGWTGEKLEKGKIYEVDEQLKILNESEWDNNLNQLVLYKEGADKILDETPKEMQDLFQAIETKQIKPELLNSTQLQIVNRVYNAAEYLKNTQQSVTGLFNKAWKYGTPEERKELERISQKFKEKIDKDPSIRGRSNALQELMIGLQNDEKIHPVLHESLDKFAMNNASKTFGNLAWQSYEKFKDKAPVIGIENPPYGGAFSTGEDLKNMVKASRKQFVETAIKNGMSEKQAEKQAEKLIGVTWDVGHINMLRKHGFDEKDIIKESETVAPYVNKVHLSDNFGFEHTELPMGMGNVPIKEIMEKLGKKGFEASKIIEAGNWWQHFQTPPFQQSLEAFGSPIYGMQMAPYWNQSIGLNQGYFSGYGMMLPDQNYQTWGAGFSQLPAELGGQRPGAGSRMSGRGME